MSTGEVITLLAMLTALVVALVTASIFIGRKIERMETLEKQMAKHAGIIEEDRKKLDEIPVILTRLGTLDEIAMRHQRYFSGFRTEAVKTEPMRAKVPTHDEFRVLSSPRNLPKPLPRVDPDSTPPDGYRRGRK